MWSLNGLRAMYDRGETENVLNEIKGMGPPVPALRDDITTLKGWCHYRRQEFDQAYECAMAASSHQWARELMSYLCAYAQKEMKSEDAKKHVNDETLKQIADELGSSNINVANATLIRARSKDCSLLTPNQVIELVQKFEGDTTVHAANLNHNAGRFFLDKAENDGSYYLALKYFDEALGRYGMEKNLHHRAAVNFWKSLAWEKLGNKDSATEAMEKSVCLWDEQRKLDPTNAAFAKSSDNAKKRLGELQTKDA